MKNKKNSADYNPSLLYRDNLIKSHRVNYKKMQPKKVTKQWWNKRNVLNSINKPIINKKEN